MEKKTIMLGMFVGSAIGGYLPMLWGGSLFSLTSILLGGVGGIAGIAAVWKLMQTFE